MSLQQNYNTDNADCQVQELLESNTLDAFINHRNYRAGYEWQVIPNLKENQRLKWLECSDQIWIRTDGTVSAVTSCKNRMCAICSWRHARKKYAITRQIMSKIEESRALSYFMFTVTIKNMAADKLKKSIDDLMEGINRMQSCKTWKKRVLGFIRSLEITYNPKSSEYHPHIHYILALAADYRESEAFMTTYDWRKMWERSMRLNYTSQVDLREIRNDANKSIEGAVAEVSKYAVKFSSIVEHGNPDATACVMKAIHRRRLIAYGGIFKGIAAEIKEADKAESQEIRQTEDRPQGKLYVYNSNKNKYEEYKNSQW